MVAQTQSLHLKAQQSLVMTPQLQMSLKLLQYSGQELLEYIESELAKNPLLELADGEDAPADGVDAAEPEVARTETTDPADTAEAAEEPKTLAADDNNSMDMNYEETWEDSRDAVERSELMRSPSEEATSLHINGSGGSMDFEERENYYERALSEEISLRDHLLEQVTVDFTDAAERMIAAQMVEKLDANGYIDGDFSAIKDRFGCDDTLIEKVLIRLQGCDPAGVFARSLAECLALQLKEKDHLDPAMQALLDNLDLIARGDMKKLQKVCGVDAEDIADMLAELKRLNPKPGLQFNHEVTQGAQADIFLRRNPDGTWAIELNNDTLPRLLVNRRYYSEVKRHARSEHEKAYLSEQMNSANWLLKSLNSRAETILKVATELVAQQSDFFEKGIYFLKPMTLQDIAARAGVHESTVGRVTSNKYISTQRGLFELKYFFSSGLSSNVGKEDLSSKTVKHFIRELVEREDALDSVLSDDKIAEILKSRGVDVARRTVAKYREAMRIPPSSQRRRQFKVG